MIEAHPTLRRVAAAALALGLALSPTFATSVSAAPLAEDDAYTTSEDADLEVPAPGVLENDLEPSTACVLSIDATTLVGSLVEGPDLDGHFLFRPEPDWHGTTTFTYTLGLKIGDECTASSTDSATVTITVDPVNDAPTAKADSFQALRERTLNVAGPGVLLNDGDVDGDSLVAQKASNPAHGTVTLAPDGGFSYTPNAGYIGPDGFSYRASDGTDTSPVRVVSIAVTAIPTPAPTIAPTPVPTVEATPSVAPAPTASTEPAASADPIASSSAGPSVGPSGSPGASIAPAPIHAEGGLSIPVLVVGLLLLSMVAFGGAFLLPKWLARQRPGGNTSEGPPGPA
jgi:hypothetical protein